MNRLKSHAYRVLQLHDVAGSVQARFHLCLHLTPLRIRRTTIDMCTIGITPRTPVIGRTYHHLLSLSMIPYIFKPLRSFHRSTELLQSTA
jgi:hypothetical protein